MTFIDYFIKARQIKYIKRTPKKNGKGFDYVYKEGEGKPEKKLNTKNINIDDVRNINSKIQDLNSKIKNLQNKIKYIPNGRELDKKKKVREQIQKLKSQKDLLLDKKQIMQESIMNNKNNPTQKNKQSIPNNDVYKTWKGWLKEGWEKNKDNIQSFIEDKILYNAKKISFNKDDKDRLISIQMAVKDSGMEDNWRSLEKQTIEDYKSFERKFDDNVYTKFVNQLFKEYKNEELKNFWLENPQKRFIEQIWTEPHHKERYLNLYNNKGDK